MDARGTTDANPAADRILLGDRLEIMPTFDAESIERHREAAEIRRELGQVPDQPGLGLE